MSCIQFADDTTLLASHHNIRYLQFCVESELLVVQDWFRANKLTLNIEKTSVMVFSKHMMKHQIKITLNSVTVPQVQSTKFLGVWIDDKLNWSTHIGVF